ncbi:MAG: GNAT family N-acetyltransferase [Rhodospirillaceae bacterium]
MIDVLWTETTAQRRQAGEWLSERLEGNPNYEVSDLFAAGVVNDGTNILAVVAYHTYFPSSGTVQLSVAADTPKWATKRVLKELLGFPFRVLGCNKAWAACRFDNTRAIQFNQRLGMTREAILRQHFGPNTHAVIQSMLLREYEKSRWV